MEKIGVICEFSCAGCSKKYSGKTKRKLINRITQHLDPKHDSAVSRHIHGTKYVFGCDTYKKKLQEKYGPKASNEEKLAFGSGCFSVVESNLSNLNRRKNCEAILIKLKQPILNNQVFHWNIKIF